MKAAVDTGLKAANAPIEWATIADGIVYTAQIPMKADGSIETGDIATQTELTLANLRQTVEAAGGSMADVTQVLVYLPDPTDFPGMNEVYRRHFPQPYPNRATVIAQLMVPGARIEIVAYAHVGGGGRGRRAAAKGKARGKTRSKAAAKATPKAAARGGRKSAAKAAPKARAKAAPKARAKAAPKARAKAAPKAAGRRGAAPRGGRRGR
jgi:enamine deaminase RidA (YjgF/YER057c/UK114 family)